MVKYHRCRNGSVMMYDSVLQMEKSGLSDLQIAKKYGITRMGFLSIRRRNGWIRKHGYIRSDKGKFRVDPEEKRQRWLAYMRKYYHDHKELNKYKRVRIGKEIKYVHRVKAELKIGRALESSEHVHHIDGNCRNNNFDNLVVCSAKEHKGYHK